MAFVQQIQIHEEGAKHIENAEKFRRDSKKANEELVQRQQFEADELARIESAARQSYTSRDLAGTQVNSIPAQVDSSATAKHVSFITFLGCRHKIEFKFMFILHDVACSLYSLFLL
jgi:hypothetical protein